MNLSLRLGAPAALGVLLTLASPVAATAAPAAPAPVLGNFVCDKGELCLFRDPGLSGPIMEYARGQDDRFYHPKTWPIAGGAIDNTVSSVWNRTNCEVRVYQFSDYNGATAVIPPGNRKNFGDTLLGDNKATSHDACP